MINDELLFELKEWIPLLEAAQHLATFCNGKIHYKDVFNYAIRGKLILSLYLKKGTRARPCELVNIEGLDSSELNYVDADGILKGYFWDSENKFINPIDNVFMSALEDYHDLVLAGGGFNELKNMAIKPSDLANSRECFGKKMEVYLGSRGIIVKDKNEQVYELMTSSPFSYEIKGESGEKEFVSHRDYHPMIGLPLHESPLGVRTQELLRFERTLLANTPETENQRRDEEDKADLAKVLDPTHDWHSENLALAIKAWVQLYAPLDKNWKKPSGGHSEFIKKWLINNLPEEKINKEKETAAENHFRYIINPDKKGGAAET